MIEWSIACVEEKVASDEIATAKTCTHILARARAHTHTKERGRGGRAWSLTLEWWNDWFGLLMLYGKREARE